MRSRMKLRAAGVALLICALAGGCGTGKPTSDGLTAATAFRAEEVAQEVRAATQAACRRYEGRTLSLAGRIESLKRRPGDLVVSLFGLPPAPPVHLESMPVECFVRGEDEDKVVDLSIGQEVTVRGRIAELTPWGVRVEGCEVEAVGPDPVVPVPMSEVADEFKKNPSAAEQKYAGRSLTLTGAVVERKDSDSRRQLRLVSQLGTPGFGGLLAVWDTTDAVDNQRFEAVKPGDRVNIKCRFQLQLAGTVVFCDCRLVP